MGLDDLIDAGDNSLEIVPPQIDVEDSGVESPDEWDFDDNEWKDKTVNENDDVAEVDENAKSTSDNVAGLDESDIENVEINTEGEKHINDVETLEKATENIDISENSERLENLDGSENPENSEEQEEHNEYDFRKVNWESESLDFLKNEVYKGEDAKDKIKDIDDAIKGIRNLTKENIKEATNIALNNKHGEYYTDHNEGHIEQVTYKSIEAGKAFADMAADGGFDYGDVANNDKLVKFGSDIDYKVLAGAAMSHDTGMSDHGYNVYMEKGIPKRNEDGSISIEEQTEIDRESKFVNVRSSHTLNSAINILKRRDEYMKLGYNDEQIDNMAVLAFAHSKSNSGVRDLTSKENWNTCFDVLDAAIGQYNADNKDNVIKFDRLKTSSDDNLSRLALSTLALRVGDVSRDSGDDAVAQSGEQVHVNKSLIDNTADTWENEVKNDKCVTANGKDMTIGDSKEEKEEAEISRKCHVGEQNIIHNKTYYNKEKHQLVDRKSVV